jgi:hypothetical protein
MNAGLFLQSYVALNFTVEEHSFNLKYKIRIFEELLPDLHGKEFISVLESCKTGLNNYCSKIKVTVKLSLCFNRAPRHEGVLGEWRYNSTHSLTSTLDGGEWSASRPGRFTPKERAPGTHWIGGWVGPRAVLDMVVKRKNSQNYCSKISVTSLSKPTEVKYWPHIIQPKARYKV